jgi:hypothetical protein
MQEVGWKMKPKQITNDETRRGASVAAAASDAVRAQRGGAAVDAAAAASSVLLPLATCKPTLRDNAANGRH